MLYVLSDELEKSAWYLFPGDLQYMYITAGKYLECMRFARLLDSSTYYFPDLDYSNKDMVYWSRWKWFLICYAYELREQVISKLGNSVADRVDLLRYGYYCKQECLPTEVVPPAINYLKQRTQLLRIRNEYTVYGWVPTSGTYKSANQYP